MAGSTESNKRMGEMVKDVANPQCPQGYSGVYPDCKKIKPVVEAVVTYDKTTTKNIKNKKERRKQRRINRKNK